MMPNSTDVTSMATGSMPKAMGVEISIIYKRPRNKSFDSSMPAPRPSTRQMAAVYSVSHKSMAAMCFRSMPSTQ